MRNSNTTVYKGAGGKWEWVLSVIDSAKNKIVTLEKGSADTEEEAIEQAEIAKIKDWCQSSKVASAIFDKEGKAFYHNILCRNIKRNDFKVIESININAKMYYLAVESEQEEP